MKIYTKEQLQKILENDFLLNPEAFTSFTQYDVQDSMCICHCLEREWTELFAKWVDNYSIVHDGKEYINHLKTAPKAHEYGTRMVPEKEREIERILDYYESMKHLFVTNELHGKARWGRVGTMDAMDYTVNY